MENNLKNQNAAANDNELKIKRNLELNEQYIRSVMGKTGWSYEVAVQKIRDARKRIKITSHDYDFYNFFNIPEENQAEEYTRILERRERKIQNREHCIATTMEHTGWSYEYAKEQIEDARKRLNIFYKDYECYAFYKIPVEEQKERYKEILRIKARRKRKEQKNEKYAQLVMANTGWTHEQALGYMDEAKARTGASYEDYFVFRFWELDEELQETYLTRGHGDALRKKYNSNRANIECFRNKRKFNEIFHKYLGRPWLCNTSMNLKKFKETFKNEPKIIYKPMEASCGAGVTVYELREDNIESVYKELSNKPEGVIEGYIVQHPELAKFAPSSVNTIRVTTIFANNEVNIIFAFFRMGGGESVVDNFHRGGVLAMLDLESGKVVTPAIDLAGKLYARHPYTKRSVLDFSVPHWDAIVKMVKEAGRLVKGVGYIGWDVALTENGPLLIEGNTAVSPTALQQSYAKQGRGVRYVIEKYL